MVRQMGALVMPSDPQKYPNTHLLYPALSHDQNKCHPINLVSCYLHIYLLTKYEICGVQFYALALGTKVACYSSE
jgi:hypothetical protein